MLPCCRCLCSCACSCHTRVIYRIVHPINRTKYFGQSRRKTICEAVRKDIPLEIQPTPPGRLYMELKAHTVQPEVMWVLGYPISDPRYPSMAIFNHSPPPSAAVFRNNDDATLYGTAQCPSADQHLCARCEIKFNVLEDGEYEPCFYHWGRADNGKHVCCDANRYTKGCTSAPRHVWNGLQPGTNTPRPGFRRSYKSGVRGVYALDVEMVYTENGLEAVRVVLLREDGCVAYKATMKPTSKIIDYNTRFSSITENDLRMVSRTLESVQMEILDIVGVDTLLVGHALENDLRALKIVHNCVVDTAILYPHPRGLPWRRSLRALAAEELWRDVQVHAHTPAEDARAALDLCRVFVNAAIISKSLL